MTRFAYLVTVRYRFVLGGPNVLERGGIMKWTKRGKTWTLKAGGTPVAHVREVRVFAYRAWRTVVGGRLNPFWEYSEQAAKARAVALSGVAR